jgi:hypothetical protein
MIKNQNLSLEQIVYRNRLPGKRHILYEFPALFFIIFTDRLSRSYIFRFLADRLLRCQFSFPSFAGSANFATGENKRNRLSDDKWTEKCAKLFDGALKGGPSSILFLEACQIYKKDGLSTNTLILFPNKKW